MDGKVRGRRIASWEEGHTGEPGAVAVVGDLEHSTPQVVAGQTVVEAGEGVDTNRDREQEEEMETETSLVF